MSVPYDHDHENEVIAFAETNYRNQRRRFGIKTDDRRRHMYVLGKTGMGKTTMLENMVIQDIARGHGVGVVDPHGDFAEKIINYIPADRINDVIYFNPADTEYPVGFNVLEAVDERHKHLVSSGLMGVFKKIWPDVWSARMEHILNNCILALLDYPGSTLLGINRILVDREYRRRVISKITDPIVKAFWVDEYARWEDRFRNEAIAPIQNKVGQFLSASVIRNIVAQVKSTINPREIMDEGKIFIMNLAKGRIGEDSSRLLGGMLITKLQLAAMERVDVPEEDRRDYYLYVDEFQNFATQSFANILSEARKYHLNLIIAHQYIEQLDEDYVRPAVFGNVGTMLTFRVGGADAEFLESEFTPRLLPEDLVNLTKYEMYLKLMINGVASEPFSAQTLPPISGSTGNLEKVIKVSRERYTEPRAVIEEKVLRWTGMTPPGEEGEFPEEEKGMKRGGMGEEKRTSAPAGRRPQFEATCSKCGKKFSVGFQPDPNRPFFCDECFVIVKEERERGKSKAPRLAPERGVVPTLGTVGPEKRKPRPPPIGRTEPVIRSSGGVEPISLQDIKKKTATPAQEQKKSPPARPKTGDLFPW